eukprot:CAMPEP_0170553954 /NCGR_PEP_ID=MMETSP0211-20121228/11793_1 /TAXON_ID=311385 /ORGANISM="Pseudokeronopsis sp., Strain OXSARD2" /LENGTH=73 /DNA_ID=CAMNT_0010862653 /DNA_START=776 /DNA_END=997 /DNA_ORIENTATION=+
MESKGEKILIEDQEHSKDIKKLAFENRSQEQDLHLKNQYSLGRSIQNNEEDPYGILKGQNCNRPFDSNRSHYT